MITCIYIYIYIYALPGKALAPVVNLRAAHPPWDTCWVALLVQLSNATCLTNTCFLQQRRIAEQVARLSS